MDMHPVKAKEHGIIDYAFSILQIAAPVLLKLNSKAVKTYGGLGTALLVLNALTKTPVGLNKTVSFKKHKKADSAYLTLLAVLPLLKYIGKSRKAVYFNLALLGIGVGHYLLTDYNSKRK